MQKFVNEKDNMTDESIIGFSRCYRKSVLVLEGGRTLKYIKAPVAGKVGVVTGGGWGHDPAFMGYLGKNMVDAVAIGDTFSPPSAGAFAEAFRAADSGEGVVCLFGNFPQDIASVDAAIALVSEEGIKVRSVVANDDVAESDVSKRRGASGEVLLWKVGGAAAALGYDLDRVIRVSQKAVENMRSIAIGLASCIIPATGRQNYLIEKGTMEIGISHHGLMSKDTYKLRTACETANIMLEYILKTFPLAQGEDVVVMLSGLGNTMLSELHILYSHIDDVMKKMGVNVYRAMPGNYFTSLDMMGATLTMMRLDDELKQLIDYPAYPVAFNHFNFVD